MSRELRPERAIYRIEEAIGQGLSATVYRAIREDSRGLARQTVALKVLKSENAVPWLRREFETLAKVRSRNCVSVLGWENLPEGCAIVLEWIDGVSLLDLGKEQTLSESVITEILFQVQEGLRALDEESLFHGDLSPANILIDRDGIVKLIDFALPVGGPEEILGTPAYLAPEHWQGEPRSMPGDLFALGLIELDLRSCFKNFPNLPERCRARAEMATNEFSSWLAPRAEAREFRDLNHSPDAARELAMLVRRHLARHTRVTTAIISKRVECKPNSPWVRKVLRPVAAAVAAFSFILAGPGRADAPPLSGGQRGTLEFRSVKWFEVSLNGRHIGFSPVAIRNLHPGTHRIAWRSATGAGEARVYIQPGQKVFIRGEDLEQSRKARKD